MLRHLYHKYLYKYPTVRTNVEALNSTKGSVIHFLHQLPDLSIAQITGDLGRIIFIGTDGPVKTTVLHTMFPEGYEETKLDIVKAWQLPRYTSKWLNENDIILCRASRFFPIPIRAKYAFDNPLTVQQILPLDRPLDELFAGGKMSRLRNEINRMLKRHYTVRISHSHKDLKFFYNEMYVPTLQKRHQDQARQLSYSILEEQFQKGFLMFLSLEEKNVLGNLCYLRGNTLYVSSMGLMEGDLSLMKLDANRAWFWYSIEAAYEREMEAINFMLSNAWSSDGVFYFKQRWGAHTHPNTYENEKLLFRANRLSTAWRDRINDIGFLTRKGQDHLQIYIDEAKPSVEEAHTLAVKNGLKGIQVIKPGQKQNIAELHPVKNTRAITEK